MEWGIQLIKKCSFVPGYFSIKKSLGGDFLQKLFRGVDLCEKMNWTWIEHELNNWTWIENALRTYMIIHHKTHFLFFFQIFTLSSDFPHTCCIPRSYNIFGRVIKDNVFNYLFMWAPVTSLEISLIRKDGNLSWENLLISKNENCNIFWTKANFNIFFLNWFFFTALYD